MSRAGCISASLLGDFSTFLRRIGQVGRLRVQPTRHAGVFWLDFAFSFPCGRYAEQVKGRVFCVQDYRPPSKHGRMCTQTSVAGGGQA